MKNILYTIMALALVSNSAQARTDPTEESQRVVVQNIIDAIKVSCSNAHPIDDAKFRECATVRYDAAKWFFATLYNYRDTKGIESEEFKKGIDCSIKYSPYVNEPGRERALELADWLKIKTCYESALSR